MTPTDEELDEQFWLTFNDILKRRGNRSFNQQKRAYEAWLATYGSILEARGRGEQALEVRRHVAATLVSEAITAKRPLATFERLIAQIETLGWSSLYRRALVTAGMCRYFSLRMWNKQGMRYLLPLRKDVEAEQARTQEDWIASALPTLRRIEERLRARRRPF